jgi:hypothetical protein
MKIILNIWLKIIAGRVYSKSDTLNEVVVNETLVNKLGIKNPQDILAMN